MEHCGDRSRSLPSLPFQGRGASDRRTTSPKWTPAKAWELALPAAHGPPGFVVSCGRDGATPHGPRPGLGMEGGDCGSWAPSSLEGTVKKAGSEKGRVRETPPMVNVDRGRGGGSLVVGRRERREESSSRFSFEVTWDCSPLSFSRPSQRAEGTLLKVFPERRCLSWRILRSLSQPAPTLD